MCSLLWYSLSPLPHALFMVDIKTKEQAGKHASAGEQSLGLLSK